MMKTLGSCQSSLSLPQTLKVPIAYFFILDSGLELDQVLPNLSHWPSHLPIEIPYFVSPLGFWDLEF